ncbi:hypothetical protein [Mycolicibacterium hippocampi]|uniref:hypothetical protein n=1 Tax=Mycolicibacterium hippocampi TaxID=659824 RepID=UPI003518A389
MDRVFLGSEAIASGAVTPGALRYRHRRVFPNVYVAGGQPPCLADNTVGAWLWSWRRGVITGRAAAALHGALWVDDDCPIELNYNCRRPPKGIITRNEHIASDEVIQIGDMAVATVQRAAFDLGRYLPRERAVAHLDALANATGLTAEKMLPIVARHPGVRGVKKLRTALDLMDGGAQSPKETWLRLLLIDNGFRRPTTQIPVLNGRGVPFAFLDMGWEDVRIAVEYDGDHHRKSRSQYVWDEQRLRLIRARDWLHIKVIKEDRPCEILARVANAWRQRERAFPVAETAS